jgi:hypothetical protein
VIAILLVLGKTNPILRTDAPELSSAQRTGSAAFSPFWRKSDAKISDPSVGRRQNAGLTVSILIY